jgi:hypothetical protein
MDGIGFLNRAALSIQQSALSKTRPGPSATANRHWLNADC